MVMVGVVVVVVVVREGPVIRGPTAEWPRDGFLLSNSPLDLRPRGVARRDEPVIPSPTMR